MAAMRLACLCACAGEVSPTDWSVPHTRSRAGRLRTSRGADVRPHLEEPEGDEPAGHDRPLTTQEGAWTKERQQRHTSDDRQEPQHEAPARASFLSGERGGIIGRELKASSE